MMQLLYSISTHVSTSKQLYIWLLFNSAVCFTFIMAKLVILNIKTMVAALSLLLLQYVCGYI